MTRYNIAKAREETEAKDIKIVALEKEINKLMGENKDLCDNNTKNVEKALGTRQRNRKNQSPGYLILPLKIRCPPRNFNK